MFLTWFCQVVIFSLIQLKLTNSFFFLSSWFSGMLWQTDIFVHTHIHTMSCAVSLCDDDKRTRWCDSSICFSNLNVGSFVTTKTDICTHLQRKTLTCSFINDPGTLADKTVMLCIYVYIQVWKLVELNNKIIDARAWQKNMGSGQIFVFFFTGHSLPVFGCDLLNRKEFCQRDVDVFP